jgi:hypothetical protein
MKVAVTDEVLLELANFVYNRMYRKKAPPDSYAIKDLKTSLRLLLKKYKEKK